MYRGAATVVGAFAIWFTLKDVAGPVPGKSRFEKLATCEEALRKSEEFYGGSLAGTMLIFEPAKQAAVHATILSAKCGPVQASK